MKRFFSRLGGALSASAVIYAVFILPLCIWLLTVYGLTLKFYPMPMVARYAVGTIVLAPVAAVCLDLVIVTAWCLWGALVIDRKRKEGST